MQQIPTEEAFDTNYIEPPLPLPPSLTATIPETLLLNGNEPKIETGNEGGDSNEQVFVIFTSATTAEIETTTQTTTTTTTTMASTAPPSMCICLF